MEQEKEKQMNVDVVNADRAREEAEEVAEERTADKRTPAQEEFVSLFENNEAEKFRSQWLVIQSRFVDDPSAAVKEADELVAEVIKSITRSFADRRISLESQWNSGEDISTEDLRLAIQRYRSFFNRLLSLKS
ncbi:MAG TPA: hypothetical protein VI524_06115 [Anaerolineales bacterium]|nr:hypothetical protein [Anaerolineales bacterium]